MHAILGYSQKTDDKEAVYEAIHPFQDKQPTLIVFFSDSPRFPAFTTLLHTKFPTATILGASTHASFSPRGFCRQALSIAALQDDLAVSAGIIREISRHPSTFYQTTVLDTLKNLDTDTLSSDTTCCFVLNPAGTACEEMVLDTLGTTLDNLGIPILGGSASSEICLSGSVSLNGEVYANSSIFTLIHLKKGRLNIQLENIYQPMGIQYTVTKADPVQRTIYELDGQPADIVLCNALQVPLEKLAEALTKHPLGRQPTGNLYIDEIERINPDHSITTYCRILENSQISLLAVGDFPTTMEQSLTNIKSTLGLPEFSIIVNCFSRVNLYLKNGWMDDFTQKLNNGLGKYIGFTSHGEQLGDFNLNLTLLILSFQSD